MTQKVPLMILPIGISRKISRPIIGLSTNISRLVSGLKYDLRETEIKLKPSEYVGICLVNAFVFFVVFSGLLYFLNTTQGKTMQEALTAGLLYGAVIALLVLYALIRYPKILAGKRAELVDKHLIFALKDLQLQITSGVTLYNGLVNVAKAGYGQASVEINKVARDIETGTPVDKALEKMAIKSKSDFLRRTTWQLINTLKAGASLKGALSSLIDDLTLDRKDKIKSYTQELNLWVLMYLLFAVAVPSIGATLLIVLSSFAGFDITPQFLAVFVTICLIIQVILIGFVKTRRPVVTI